MSAIFGEVLSFGQAQGNDVELRVFGDEHYARHETLDGYSVVYDNGLGRFAYAVVIDGRFVSSGVAVADAPPAGTPRHLQESEAVRQSKHEARRTGTLPPPPAFAESETMRTIGPNQGLLQGRRLSVGDVRGLTILVEFQDVRSTVTKADVNELLNGANYTGNGNFCSAAKYFEIVSSGKLRYTNDVVGPYRLSRNRQHYVENLLVQEALDLAIADGVDLTRFDSRSEGIIDALNILYAGQTQYLKNLWPHNSFVDIRRGSMRTNLYLLTSMGRNASDLSIGTFCHENGHLLCRFPDMYDYGNRDGDGAESAGIGVYCLMGSGNHLNSGRTPSPVCGYLRELAGWCDDVVDLASLPPGPVEARHGTYNTVLKFGTDRLNEYFVVENRSKIGLDQHLPASGLAVYHCDTKGSNEWQEGSSIRHYQCALLQADGRKDLERNANQGDGTDLFGNVAGVALSHATNPSAQRWDGADSGLVLRDVSAPGQAMRFSLGGTVGGAAVRGESSPALAIPDNNPTGVSSVIDIAGAGRVRELKVSVDITHTYRADLKVTLTSPGGQTQVLHDGTGGSTDNLVLAAVSMPGLQGVAVQGAWTLRVVDTAAQDTGTLNRWSLEAVVDPAVAVVARASAAPALAIPDLNSAGISSTVTIAEIGTIAKAAVAVDITHPYVGDLRVELVSPSGRAVVLHGQVGDGQDDLTITYGTDSPGSPLAALLGQAAAGVWLLRVADLARADVGVLRAWSIELTLA